MHHHPFVTFANTQTYGLLLVSLADESPADPRVYYLDHEDYRAIAATSVGRMSAFLSSLRLDA